ncbi:helix-turn-helix transcriptional regulator [Adlercreutzia sp. R25]|uniref:helix-turn-helix transcriptional regulator n=1 Tax=Adlercreutzia shanghongiae TaxID=3111773 RepID=UPI002DB63E60|nr:helix-turn-helix transcriptional regulator [Adlercreutzia sp. R25]MEC4273761.1 helix-turn-helix transcriptional regulator [Adlercreutzia sp. R25]
MKQEISAVGQRAKNSFHVPLCFLGMGVYRAWIELTYTNPPFPLPINSCFGANVPDVLLAIVLLAAALLSKRLYPLHKKRLFVWTCALAMALATALKFWSAHDPSLTQVFSIPATALSTFGAAIIILLWCELFSCLSPYRVILYFSASLAVGWILVFFLGALASPQIDILASTLPFLSAACAYKSFTAIAPSSADTGVQTNRTFPWKIVFVMAAFTFAFSLFESSPSALGGPLSSAGMLAMALIVFVAAALFTDRIRIESLFRISMPLMAVGLLLASLLVQQSSELVSFFISASYAAFLIMIMAIMCDLTYRLSVNPLWLFGIERFIRFVTYALGANALSLLDSHDVLGIPTQTILGIAAIALILCSTTLLFTDRNLLRDWSVPLDDGAGELDQARLVSCCNQIAREYKLSSREQEVFLLLVEGEDVAGIEKKLFIANGTAKSHIQHIYKKVGVHSKQELLSKVANPSRNIDPSA